MSQESISNLLTYCRGILSNRTLRRKWLGWITAILVLGFFVGAVPGGSWLESRPLYFLIYWAGIIWLLIFVILFALYDLLSVLRETHRVRRSTDASSDKTDKTQG